MYMKISHEHDTTSFPAPSMHPVLYNIVESRTLMCINRHPFTHTQTLLRAIPHILIWLWFWFWESCNYKTQTQAQWGCGQARKSPLRDKQTLNSTSRKLPLGEKKNKKNHTHLQLFIICLWWMPEEGLPKSPGWKRDKRGWEHDWNTEEQPPWMVIVATLLFLSTTH